MTAQELHDWFFSTIDASALRPVATAPLPAGHGVKGWLTVRAPAAGLEHFTDDRLRLLDGLAYRTSMAIQKALLYREQRENAHVANALLEFARALAQIDELQAIHEHVVEQTAHILGVEKVSLWLEDAQDGGVTAVAVCEEDEAHRQAVLAHRFSSEHARQFTEAGQPYVLSPDDYAHVPGALELGAGRHLAIAPFRFDGGRMGFLVVGDGRPGAVDDVGLKMLAGLADQAKLAIAGAR
jgi:GAF domain-containing protein